MRRGIRVDDHAPGKFDGMSEEDVESYFEGLLGGGSSSVSQGDEVLAEYSALLRGELPEEEVGSDASGPVMPWDNSGLAGDVLPGVPLAYEAQVNTFPFSRSALCSLDERGVQCLMDLLSVDICSVPRVGESTRLDLLRYMMSRSRRIPAVPRWARAWQLDTGLGSALFFLDQAGTLCCSPAPSGMEALPEEREGPSCSSEAVDAAVAYFARLGYRFYEPSLRTWLSSLDSLPVDRVELARALDALVSDDSLRETFDLGCWCAIATWYEGQTSLGSTSGRSWSICFPDVPWWRNAAASFVRNRPSLIFDEEECEIRFRPTTLDEFLAAASSSRFSAFRLYLDGLTFEGVGELLGCSRVSARQLVFDSLNKVPPLKEDALIPLVEKYSIGWDQFRQLVCTDRKVFSYLKLRRTRGGDRAPIEFAVSDDEVPEIVRERICVRASAAKRSTGGGVAEELMRMWRRLRKERGSIECSARLAFDLYPAVMERIGAKDEFELFELSKTLLSSKFRAARFGPEIPIVKIGYCSRIEQIFRLIDQLGPVNEEVLFEEYYRLYRVDRSAFHDYLARFKDYRDEQGAFHKTKVG